MAALVAGRVAAADGIAFLPVEKAESYPNAVAPDALRYACADTRRQLAVLFQEKDLRLDPGLIRPKGRHLICHIFYEPTVPGFKASADDETVTGLYAVADPLAFILNPRPIGESLDVVKSVLSQVERPLDVKLKISSDYDPAYWDPDRHFAGSPHRIELHPVPADIGYPWAQDHIKAGYAAGRRTILLPRRLYEGRGDNELVLDSLIDTYQGEAFTRSKLSWEGGDLVFVSSPKAPQKLILVFGLASWDYWGSQLDRDEFAYVLRTEFGADATVDLSEVGPHADLLVAFFPEDRLALVAYPERENHLIALGAAVETQRIIRDTAPREANELVELLRKPGGLGENPEHIRQAVWVLRGRLSQVAPAVDSDIMAAFEQYASRHCEGKPTACLSMAGRDQMIQLDPDLMRRMTQAGNEGRLDAMTLPALLAIIEGQLPDAPRWKGKLLDQKADDIRKFGFRVERVPYLIAPDNVGDWAGISYANLFSLDGQVFVPTFGLGDGETRILRGMEEKLGEDYKVIPIPARASLLLNAGVHCVFGIIREPDVPAQIRLSRRKRRRLGHAQPDTRPASALESRVVAAPS